MTQGEVATDKRATPTTLYTWAGVIITLLVLSALLSFLAIQTLSATGDRIQNGTGPVLISTQGLVASIAEADSANTAVYLSGLDGGDEDVSQRRLYESAVARAPEQIEDISSGIGDDDTTHDALKVVARQLTEYAGVVEQARLSNATGLSGADDLLSDSLELSGGESGMLASANVVSNQTREQFTSDRLDGFGLWIFSVVILIVTLLVLLAGQRRLRKLTQRRISLGLLGAVVCVVTLLAWLVAAGILRSNDLTDSADRGVADIVLTAELQTAAFAYKTAETSAIIQEDPSELPESELVTEVNDNLSALIDSGDSPRERAQAEIVAARWQSYLDVSADINSRVVAGDFDTARELVAGDGNQSFNGFNTTAEALVLANQDQFNDSVANATARLRFLSFASILLPLLAAALAWLGYRPRINEYY